jgi:hypothetical protein
LPVCAIALRAPSGIGRPSFQEADGRGRIGAPRQAQKKAKYTITMAITARAKDIPST